MDHYRISRREVAVMSERIKITLIIAATAIFIVAVRIYFSPYHSCVRAYETVDNKPQAECARLASGH